MHLIPCALVLVLASAGKSIDARMAIIAMTTSSSIRVKPLRTARLVPVRQREQRETGEGFGFMTRSRFLCASDSDSHALGASPALRPRFSQRLGVGLIKL